MYCPKCAGDALPLDKHKDYYDGSTVPNDTFLDVVK